MHPVAEEPWPCCLERRRQHKGGGRLQPSWAGGWAGQAHRQDLQLGMQPLLQQPPGRRLGGGIGLHAPTKEQQATACTSASYGNRRLSFPSQFRLICFLRRSAPWCAPAPAQLVDTALSRGVTQRSQRLPDSRGPSRSLITGHHGLQGELTETMLTSAGRAVGWAAQQAMAPPRSAWAVGSTRGAAVCAMAVGWCPLLKHGGGGGEAARCLRRKGH